VTLNTAGDPDDPTRARFVLTPNLCDVRPHVARRQFHVEDPGFDLKSPSAVSVQHPV